MSTSCISNITRRASNRHPPAPHHSTTFPSIATAHAGPATHTQSTSPTPSTPPLHRIQLYMPSPLHALWSSPAAPPPPSPSPSPSTMPPAPTPDPPPTASLHPSFCLSTTALRDFLRLARSPDDTISASLNSLLTPSTSPFSTAAPRPRTPIPPARCADFTRRVLFPSWRARDDVLQYCARVADDATAAAVDGPVPPLPAESAVRRTNRNAWGREVDVDERLDPYSARDYSYTRASAAEELRGVLATERVVEGIVRARTWGVVRERCTGGDVGRGWEEEWEEWRRGEEARERG